MRKHYYYNPELDLGHVIKQVSQSKDSIVLEELIINQGKPWVKSVCTMQYTTWRRLKKQYTHKSKKPVLKVKFIPFEHFVQYKE